MTNQNQSKPKTKFYKKPMIVAMAVALILMPIIFAAIYTGFKTTKTDSLQIQTEYPTLSVQTNDSESNNKTKKLIANPFPNFNDSKYAHAIDITHDVKIVKNSMDINKDLYLKITTEYDAHGTFGTSNPNSLLSNNIISNGTNYSESTKQKFVFLGNEAKISNKISVFQPDFLPSTIKSPNVDLLTTYEVVDSQGSSLQGGQQTVRNTITNTAR